MEPRRTNRPETAQWRRARSTGRRRHPNAFDDVAVDYGDGVAGAPPPLRAHDGATTGDRIYG
ncbi:hypothetical protein KU306_14340 [Haloferax larsenii]|uniref:Uncharacterized protein n=1 Tax=Haloferax larsenii TaxID=302484 RepID=A0ABY5RDU6_HALLR|nr:hypothetical protein [Haloferax larsenii]UVE50068.1 hypothetical protein KU306_14340 [Haloferax larsenii]